MCNAAELKVGGLQPLTSIDYPNELAAVIFCQGCPWRCRYCHNSELIPANGATALNWQQVRQFLLKRQGLLDAVVFSGGEPTLQPALKPAIEQAKALGYKIGLHSSGGFPERLAALLPLIDWIGLDVKALPENYPSLTGHKRSGKLAWQSAQLVIESGVAHQIRITRHQALMSEQEQQAIISRLTEMGAQEIVLQQVNTTYCLDPELRMTSSEA